jgi:hypothetical protein
MGRLRAAKTAPTRRDLEEFRLNLFDLLVLLHNVLEGAQDSEVGYEDAEYTLKQLVKKLSRRTYPVRRATLESALWSCNLMDEAGTFWHPEGMSFDDYCKKSLRDRLGVRFDKCYNLLAK